ncbi:dehydrogenase reductase [Colletotrichum truncatum]|uniref:Dehydrogenase reductase n=1 Tax=Colletotrichum truncatum TaxID=5467 RepID=A0ACC3YD16_COLTU|nr:dehydrogenase reductase [Colletotrichum truncatum]KAF6783559.1 dehydrogenase reductase [Colletotrichum truncatum]
MVFKNSFIITGGTQGMGYHAALIIAKEHPEFLVVILARSDRNHAAETINKTLGQSNTIFMPIDLGNPDSVRRFVKNWIADTSKPQIKGLVMNAALQFPTTLQLTDEGMEKTFAISHVGHAILFHLLCPYLATGSRIVLTSSGTHDPAQKSGLPDAEYNSAEELAFPPPSKVDIPGRKRYSTTKLCNVLWAYALARHLAERAPERGITVNAMDPGLMPGTGLAREASAIEGWLWNSVLPHMLGLLRIIFNPNVHTPAESAAALARLAVSPSVEGVTGKYFEGLKEIMSSNDSYVKSKQEDLWNWTINYVAQGDESEAERLRSLK